MGVMKIMATKTLNPNLEIATQKILEDPNVCDYIMLCVDDMDEIYETFKHVHEGYTRYEFDEYMEDVFENFFEFLYTNQDKIMDDEMQDDELQKIAGGTKIPMKKMLSISLSTLITATPLVMSPSFNAASSVSTEQVAEKKQSFWERHKDTIKKVAIGVGVTAVTGLALYGGYKLIDHFVLNRNKPQEPAPNPVAPNDGTNPANQPVKSQGSSEQEDLKMRDNRLVTQSRAEKKAESVKDWIYDKAPGIGKVALGLAIGGILLRDVIEVAKGVNDVPTIYGGLKRIITGAYKWTKRKLNPTNLSTIDRMANLEELFKNIKGQERVKKEVRGLVSKIIVSKDSAKVLEQKYNKASLLYFTGTSGVGKTMLAQGLATYKVLTDDDEPYILSASSIDPGSKNESAVEQLFGTDAAGDDSFFRFRGFDDDDDKKKKPRGLENYLKSCDGNGLVVINEWDKIYKSLGPGVAKHLEEVLRTAVDDGEIKFKGKVFDCRGVTFVLTSNEDIDGLDPNDTSLTSKIDHDESFLRRIKILKFDKLIYENYEEIIATQLKNDVLSYWKLPTVAGLDIYVDGEEIEKMAEFVTSQNVGAREVELNVVTPINNLIVEYFTSKLPAEVLTKKEKDLAKYFKNNRIEIICDYSPESKYGDMPKFSLKEHPKIANLTRPAKKPEQKQAEKKARNARIAERIKQQIEKAKAPKFTLEKAKTYIEDKIADLFKHTNETVGYNLPFHYEKDMTEKVAHYAYTHFKELREVDSLVSKDKDSGCLLWTTIVKFLQSLSTKDETGQSKFSASIFDDKRLKVTYSELDNEFYLKIVDKN